MEVCAGRCRGAVQRPGPDPPSEATGTEDDQGRGSARSQHGSKSSGGSLDCSLNTTMIHKREMNWYNLPREVNALRTPE